MAESGENYLLSKLPCNAKSKLTRVNIIVSDNALIVIYWTATVLYEQEFALNLPYRL